MRDSCGPPEEYHRLLCAHGIQHSRSRNKRMYHACVPGTNSHSRSARPIFTLGFKLGRGKKPFFYCRAKEIVPLFFLLLLLPRPPEKTTGEEEEKGEEIGLLFSGELVFFGGYGGVERDEKIETRDWLDRSGKS